MIAVAIVPSLGYAILGVGENDVALSIWRGWAERRGGAAEAE